MGITLQACGKDGKLSRSIEPVEFSYDNASYILGELLGFPSTSESGTFYEIPLNVIFIRIINVMISPVFAQDRYVKTKIREIFDLAAKATEAGCEELFGA